MDAWGVTLVIVSVCLILHDAISIQSVRLMSAIAAMYWLGFAINDYYDTPYDAFDVNKQQRNPFLTDAYTAWQQRASVTSPIMYMLAILLVIFLMGFASFGWRGLLIFVPSSLVMWAYSAPPVRLKSRPVFDLITHALFVQTYPYLVCLLLLDITWTVTDSVLLIFFICSSLAAQLEQQIRDYDVDKRSERNFTIVFGKLRARQLLVLLSLALFVIGSVGLLAGWLPLILLPIFIIGTFPVAHRFFRRDDKRPEHLIRVSVGLAISYALILWGYALLM